VYINVEQVRYLRAGSQSGTTIVVFDDDQTLLVSMEMSQLADRVNKG
jgi:hypothetical protein